MSNPENLEKVRKRYPVRITRGRAIKLYCKLNCCAADTVSWKHCEQKNCFLWAFRMGKESLGNQSSYKKGTKKHRESISFSGKNSVLETGTSPNPIESLKEDGEK